MTRKYSPSLLERFAHHAQNHGTKLAYIFIDRRGRAKERISFSELWSRSYELALILKIRCQKEHSTRSDNLALVYQPGIHFIIAMLASWMAGKTVVPLPPDNFLKLAMPMRSLLQQAGVRWILCDTTSSKMNLLPFADQTVVTDNYQANDLNTTASSINSMSTVTTTNAAVTVGSTTVTNNNAIIQYTSGSTSAPKGVIVSHDNLAANLQMIMQGFEHTPSSTVAGWTPHFHDQGLIGNILQPLYVGASCILMSPKSFIANPLLWLQVISRYHVYSSGGPNFAYELCVSRIKHSMLDKLKSDLDLSCWKAAFNGADVIRADTIKHFTRAFAPYGFGDNAFYPCYGLAESTLACTGGKINEAPKLRCLSWASLCQGLVKYLPNSSAGASQKAKRKDGLKFSDDSITITSCGTALPGVIVKIVIARSHCKEERDSTENEVNVETKAGTIGEIWIAGDHIAKGYLDDSINTAQVFNATLQTMPNTPFMRTGDLGFMDPSGELYFVGRSKEVIIQNGKNYAPQDIESTVAEINPNLMPHRSVLVSILECDKNFVFERSRIKETVILVQEVKRHCYYEDEFIHIKLDIRKHIANTYGLILDKVLLVRANTIPMTSSGKKQRNKIRQWYIAGKFEVQTHSQGEPASYEILD